VRLADALITEANQLLTAADLQDGAKMLRAGKRRVHRLALGS
jgi:hypothetical protein